MSKNSVFAMIVILSAFTSNSFAEANSAKLSKMDQAVLNVGASCQGVEVDQQKFDLSISEGQSAAQAKQVAAVKQSSKQIYDAAIASGVSNDDAIELGTYYKYSDNSNFCVKLRALVRAELVKSISGLTK